MNENLYQQHLSDALSCKVTAYFYARFSTVQIKQKFNILLLCKDFEVGMPA
jgi:indole-3-glycerol phosphate synthase